MFMRFHDVETCELVDPHGLHPFCLASKLNADNHPSFKEILCLDKGLCDEWFDATDKELQDLFKSRSFEFVSQDEVLKQGKEIVPMTWAFCKKHHPSGKVYCFKVRVCMRRDLQRENCANNNVSFVPVVERTTIRMLFLLSIIEEWSMASIDFKNAFAQATLRKPIHLELLPGYVQANPGAKDRVMKIKKSLYGN